MIYLTPGFRKKLADDTRDYIATADITLASGEVLNLTNTEIWGDGFEVEDAVSDDENFTALGATVIGAATLVIDNTSGQYTQYDFMNADVVLKVALMIDDTTGTRKETVKMGTFRVDSPQYNEVTINLSMLDYMEQFDRPYSLSKLVYPATLGAIVRDACTVCGVTQNTLSFPHDDFEVQERPADESTTFREVLSWAATIAGCFAKVNRDGELVIKWFNTAALEDDSGTDGGYYDDGTPYYTSGDSVDGGSFNPWNTGGTADGGDFTTEIPVHYIGSLYQQNICVDDTVITGVDIEVEDKDTSAEQQKQTYSVGTDGYKIKVTNNPFLTKENAQQVVNWLGQQLVGLTFRKCNVTHTDDPAIEAGDVGFLYDSRQEEYKILITRQRFEIGSPQTIVCGCDTPSHNSATRFTEATKSYVAARKLLKEQVDQYEQAMEDLREDIENNAHGLYAEEIEDPDNPGSYIYCLHDKPSLEQSAVRIHVSTIGVAVTANATAQSPDWYAFRVNGDLLARVIQTMNLFFDYAHGGTLTLGGANNVNGLIRVLDASGNEIGSWSKNGIIINKGTIQGPTIIAGGLSDEYGTFTVKDNDGNNRVSITKDGIRTINSAIMGGIIAYRSNHAAGYAATAGLYFKYGRSRNTDCGALEFLWYSGSEDVFNSFDDFKQKYDDGSIQRISSLSLGGERATSYRTVLELLKAGKGYGFAIASPTYNGTHNTPSSTSGNIERLYGLSYYELEYNSYKVPVLNIRGAVVIEPWSNDLGGIFWHAGTHDVNPSYWHEGSSYEICGIVPKVKSIYQTSHYGYDTNILGSLYINGNSVSSSSSRRYKECIDDLTLEELDPHKLLNLPVRQGRYKKEYNEYKLQHLDMAGRILPMLIAEEVDEIYPAATIHDNNTGEIESWDERLIIPGMLALIQEQDKAIKEQQKRLDDQQEQIDKLEKKLDYLMNLTESFSQK